MNDKNIFYAIGDLHGNAKFLLEALEKIANETKNSANLNVFIFFVGDFGFIFNGSEKEKNKKQVILNRYNFNYIVILGNHENYSLIYKLKVINVSSKSIDLQIGATSSNASVATDYVTHTCRGDNNTGVSYATYTGTLDLSSDFSYISFYHNRANVSGRIDYLCLYEFSLRYK